MYFLLVSYEQRAAERGSWERFHCLKRDVYKKTVCQSSTGCGLCEMLGISMELLRLNTEAGRVKKKKKKEGNLVPDNVVGLPNELSQSCPTL